MWPKINDALGTLFRLIYAFHMPLFFMISGYLYQLAYFDGKGKPKKEKIKAHVIDFTIVYIAFSSLMWGSKLILHNSVNNAVSVWDLLLIWAVPMPTYWYLYVLMVFYGIFSIPAISNSNIKFLVPGLVTFCVLSSWISRETYFQIHRLMYYMLFFWCGMQKQKNQNIRIFEKHYVFIEVIIALICLISLWKSNYRLDGVPIANMVIALGISCSIWYVVEQTSHFVEGYITMLITWIGTYTLEIYVAHCFIAASFRISQRKIGLLNPILCIVLNTVICILLPIVGSSILKWGGMREIIFRPYTQLFRQKIK